MAVDRKSWKAETSGKLDSRGKLSIRENGAE